MKKLSDLLKHCNYVKVIGNTEIEISGITYDSRRAKSGYAFFALSGLHTDGMKFISSAVSNGATAIFVSNIPETMLPEITYIQVSEIKKAMSAISCALYDDPSSKLQVLGVTGTDGKSSSVSFIYQILNKLGEKTGFLSTVEYSDGDTVTKNPYRQSTPESSEIMMILNEMVEHGCKYAALESTSHGLSERTQRLSDVKYQAGMLTNITHEHLEFHGTIEKYADDKANLFRKSSRFNVVNASDNFASHFCSASKVPVYSYALSSDNKNITLCCTNIKPDNAGTSFDAVYEGKNYPCRINIPGLFNVENFLGIALMLIKITGFPPERIFNLSSSLKPVKGRMEVVNCSNGPQLIVDYAHTPGAFQKLFPMMRRQVTGKLIAVFGSAGERDTEKRPIQGNIASKYCDTIILTDEDPRGEDSLAIINDIANGIIKEFSQDNLYKIPDRKQAIKKALSLATAEDTVLFLGKGHESTIIYASGTIPWDERKVIEEAIKQ